jgi:hypothetical protein
LDFRIGESVGLLEQWRLNGLMDEFDPMLLGKLRRFCGVTTQRHQGATLQASVGQRTQEFADGLHADVPCFPVFALDSRSFSVVCDDQIDPAIGMGTTTAFDGVTEFSVNKAHDLFELEPIDVTDSIEQFTGVFHLPGWSSRGGAGHWLIRDRFLGSAAESEKEDQSDANQEGQQCHNEGDSLEMLPCRGMDNGKNHDQPTQLQGRFNQAGVASAPRHRHQVYRNAFPGTGEEIAGSWPLTATGKFTLVPKVRN